MVNSTRTIGLGFVPAERRSVTPVPGWALNLVPKPEGRNQTVKSGKEDVEGDTMPLIKNKIYRTLHHTKKLAAKLKGSSLTATARNDWNFIFNHIRYRKDAQGREQVRSPRRLIHDGQGDCDCFTVTLSSLLINQGIPHYLRIMKEPGRQHWSHIYIVIPKSGKLSDAGPGNDYITLDCVTHRFNYEAPHSQTKEYPMALEYLDGISSPGGYGNLSGTKCPQIPIAQRLRRYVRSDVVERNGLIPAAEFLKQNGIPFVPAINQENESGTLLVNTPSGTKAIPTIITPAQAAQITQGSGAAQADHPAAKKDNNVWWYVLIGGMTAVLVLGPGDNSAKRNTSEPADPGLSGITRKKKLKTIHV